MSKTNKKSRHFISMKNIVRALLGLFAILFILFIINSPILKFGYVKVTGNSYLPREDILQIAQINEPINIFAVQTDKIQQDLQSDLRIESAKVWRDFPNCLNIEISERTPLAVMNCNYGYVDVDKNSIIINTYNDPKKIQKPLITGIVLQDVYTGDKIDNEAVNRVLSYLGFLSPDAIGQISQINLMNAERIELYTLKGTKIFVGDLKEPEVIAQKTNNFIFDIKAAAIPIDYIDFSYARPVLKVKQ